MRIVALLCASVCMSEQALAETYRQALTHAEAAKLIAQYDTNKDGWLSQNEAKPLRESHPAHADQVVQKSHFEFISRFDCDGCRGFSPCEHRNLTRCFKEKTGAWLNWYWDQWELKEHVADYDTNRDGLLDDEEMRRAFSQLTDDVLRRLAKAGVSNQVWVWAAEALKQFDKNENGRIGLSELAAYFAGEEFKKYGLALMTLLLSINPDEDLKKLKELASGACEGISPEFWSAGGGVDELWRYIDPKMQEAILQNLDGNKEFAQHTMLAACLKKLAEDACDEEGHVARQALCAWLNQASSLFGWWGAVDRMLVRALRCAKSRSDKEAIIACLENLLRDMNGHLEAGTQLYYVEDGKTDMKMYMKTRNEIRRALRVLRE